MTLRVCVTGASSRLARVLLPRLCARSRVEVVGIDVAAPVFAHPRYVHHRCDIRDPVLPSLLKGCDALVHLAFVVLRGRMGEAEMADVNLRGTRHVFEAAAAAGVPRWVHLSSAAVYGSGHDVGEDAPLAPLSGFLYAAHKAAIEEWLATRFPAAVRLRPHAILGPHCQPLLRQLARAPVRLMVPGPGPRLQCVHEEDVAAAIELALTRDVSGPFNLAAPGDFPLAALGRGRLRLPLPFPLARGVLTAAWRISGFGGEPGWIEGLRRGLTLDCSRAHGVLGWQPRFDAGATLAAIIAS